MLACNQHSRDEVGVGEGPGAQSYPQPHGHLSHRTDGRKILKQKVPQTEECHTDVRHVTELICRQPTAPSDSL